MNLQMGKKKLDEIEELVEANCWKALAWIHAILHRQLKYIFYYGKDQPSSKKDHEKKWKLVDDKLCRTFDNTRELCYAKSLIEKDESARLKGFNTFRNKKIGHPNIYEYLPEDEEVKKICKKGIKLIKELDEKFTGNIHSASESQ